MGPYAAQSPTPRPPPRAWATRSSPPTPAPPRVVPAEPAPTGVPVRPVPGCGRAAAAAHADGRQLPSALHPDPDQPILAVRFDPEGGRRGDDRLLEAADVAAQVERVAQLDDGVG